MSNYQVYEAQLLKQTARITRRQADKVLKAAQEEARENALVGEYSKGNLAKTIYRSGPFVRGYSASGTVGSRAPYAKAVEKGARVHNIFPKGAPKRYRFGRVEAPALKFVWRGRTVYFNQIPGARGTVGRSHPGQKGKHYLSRALVSVAARYNLRVIIRDV
jgi:hypothetical protein